MIDLELEIEIDFHLFLFDQNIKYFILKFIRLLAFAILSFYLKKKKN